MNRYLLIIATLLIFGAIGCSSVAAENPSMSQAIFYVR